MGIQEKLAEIRSKPESVRVRYLWGLVFVSMFFILMIWSISLKQKVGLVVGGVKAIETDVKSDQSIKNILDNKEKIRGEIGIPEIKPN